MEERALETLKSMLTSRGFNAETFENLGSQIDETKMYTFAGVLIIFSTKSRITEKDLNSFVLFAEENGHTSGIIIVSLSSPSETVLISLRNKLKDKDVPLVQIFELRHLQFDISKHRKVPKHRILTDEDKASLRSLADQSANWKHVLEWLENPKILPKIDSQDPMARWIGARPDDIIEITGLCETSGENKRYRFCLADVTNG
jgi:DNA-directed RNA polymerase I, II, and III subunit RPABC1